jgi:hydroxymethylglutaryl-CoA synthase
VNGVIAYGAYLPHFRLLRRDLGIALGAPAGAGSRSVASYDEDPTSMAVEAGRTALRDAARRGAAVRPARLYFATSFPPYLDRSNAAAVHAALGFDRASLAVDMAGGPRSAIGALLAAADSPDVTLAVASDIRTGLPGGSDERDGGDAAAALVFGPGTAQSPVLAEIVAHASATDEFLDRWRVPGQAYSRTWEERFVEHLYRPAAEESFAAALKLAALVPAEIDHLIVCGLSSRAATQFTRDSGVSQAAVSPTHRGVIGNPGAAQPALLLSDVLDRVEPHQTIALVQLADGATTVIFRAAEHCRDGDGQPGKESLAAQLGGPHRTVSYPTFATWRGMLNREPPRRPEPDAPAAPPAHRSAGYKFGFHASRCDACHQVNVPPARICYSCGARDQMTAISLSDVTGTVATFTVDRLAYTPSPPMIAAVIDFDGGGRFRCEIADSAIDEIRVAARVQLTFRRLLTSGEGIHNYFWKAKPVEDKPVEDKPVEEQ